MNEKLIELLLEALKTKSSNSEIASLSHPFEVGEKYFIRTVTYHSTGRIKRIVGNFLILEEGAWIADSGRLTDALKKGFDKEEKSEIEPYEMEWIINISSIVDACVYPHKLPDSQK